MVGVPATRRDGRWLVLALVAPFVLAVVTYGGLYVHARVTHRLVNYGSFVARPNAMSGIGYTWWEIAFYPLTELESFVRNPGSR